MKNYFKENQVKNFQTQSRFRAKFSASTQDENEEKENTPKANSTLLKKNIFSSQFTKNTPVKFLDLHWGFWFFIFVFFVGLTIIFTWPLILNFNTQIPGSGNVEDRCT